MSEVQYRHSLRGLLPGYLIASHHYDISQFISATLTSQLLIRDQFRLILARNDPDMSQYVVLFTRTLRIDELAPDLIRVFEVAQDGRLKHDIVHTVSSLRHEQAQAFMVAILQHASHITFRVSAAYALKMGGRETYPIPTLTAIAQNTEEDGHLRSHAVEALFYHAGKTVLPLLLSLLEDDEAEVRWAALFCIQRSRDVSLKPFVESLLNDTSIARDGETVGARAQEILDTWARKST